MAKTNLRSAESRARETAAPDAKSLDLCMARKTAVASQASNTVSIEFMATAGGGARG